jgi:hypothetical protein
MAERGIEHSTPAIQGEVEIIFFDFIQALVRIHALEIF